VSNDPPTQSEAEFLAHYDGSAFERPSLAVDVALIHLHKRGLAALLIRRDAHPYRHALALPGGFVGIGESLDDAAERVLRDKAGLSDVFLEQLYTFGAPERDPRMRIVSVAYYALIDGSRLAGHGLEAVSAEIRVPWSGEAGGPVEVMLDGVTVPLAFDHAEILGMAIRRVRGKLDYSPIGFEFLPELFTLRQLRQVHETVLGRTLNKDSFRRRMLASGQLEATGERQRAVDHRPAELYRFLT